MGSRAKVLFHSRHQSTTANEPSRERSKSGYGGSEPVVAFIDLMEAHEPHRDTLRYDRSRYAGMVPRGWSSQGLKAWDVVDDPAGHAGAIERYRALYGASIEYLDRVVSGFIDRLLDATDRETTVVLTVDHGENLALPADDGLFGHVTSLSEGVIHVPLVLINPPAGYPERIEGTFSHLDLRRLAAGFAHGETPSVANRRGPAAAEVIGVTPSNDPLVERDPDRWDRLVRCVYENAAKHIWDSRSDYTEYEIDPERPCWQRRADVDADVSATNADVNTDTDTNASPPAWATDFFAVRAGEYRRSVAAPYDDRVENRRGGVLDPGVERRLEELGYR